ncbi:MULTISPECIES: Shedu immune nuclease family protein [Pseudomonas]|uniref:Shedu immune nuclease family protein n=1 Tax=Pseudomonas TaxID=286 RepID=UPI001F0B512A|nr:MULTISPECIES: Shedu immune nuclease family protein [Pseudomonas]
MIQSFLENRSELIPTPHRLNHQLHLKAIISKFPLGNRFITDYVYITKSSDCWRIVFVELEIPDKAIFTKSSNQVNATSKFNEALNQIRSWQAYLVEHRQEVISQLEPLMVPPNMRRKPVEFFYELVYGRSSDKNTEEKHRHIKLLSDQSNIKIMTYDTLISYYENDLVFKKDIMCFKQGKYHYKNLVTKPEHVFSHIGPGDLELTNAQKEVLRNDGYEIDKWCSGEMLTRNFKCAESTFE